MRAIKTVAAVAAAGLVGVAVPAPVSAGPKAPTVIGHAKTDGLRLNLRRVPSAGGERFGSVADGAKVWILCQVRAQQITGTVRTTSLWNRLANGAYASDAYVVRPATAIPVCAPAVTPPARVTPAPVIPAPRKGENWGPPVAAGLVSGFRTVARPAHHGIDLSTARGTPILAASAGTVIRVVCNVSAGTCDVDGNRTLSGCGWYVEVQHAGDIVTRYCHLVRRPVVSVGQAVARGQLLGHVGTSGSSSGPHLHFEVHVNAAPATHDNAVDPIVFLRARGVNLG